MPFSHLMAFVIHSARNDIARLGVGKGRFVGKRELRSRRTSRWLTQRAASTTLVTVLAILLCVKLGTVNGQSRGIDLVCPCSYSIQEDSATFSALRVDFEGSGHTGTLKIRLWATTTRYAGGDISGYELVEAELGYLSTELGANESFVSPSFTQSYDTPPAGTYYITLLLTEYGEGEDYIVDYVTFDSPATFSDDGFATGGSSDSSLSTLDYDFVPIEGASGRSVRENVSIEVWIWTAPATASVTFDIQDSNVDTLLLNVHGVDNLIGLIGVASNQDTDGTLQSEVRFHAQQGQMYHITVESYGESNRGRRQAGTIVLTWQMASASEVPALLEQTAVLAGPGASIRYWTRDDTVAQSLYASTDGSVSVRTFYNADGLPHKVLDERTGNWMLIRRYDPKNVDFWFYDEDGTYQSGLALFGARGRYYYAEIDGEPVRRQANHRLSATNGGVMDRKLYPGGRHVHDPGAAARAPGDCGVDRRPHGGQYRAEGHGHRLAVASCDRPGAARRLVIAWGCGCSTS